MTTTLTKEPPMIETSRHDLESALYGICRLVSGWQDWKVVEDLPNDQKLQVLLQKTTEEFTRLSLDINNADPKVQNQVVRKLKGYQQLALLEKFCMKEVIWDE